MKNNNLSLNIRLKQLRKAKGVKQEELADYLRVTYQAVSKWERGEGTPDIMLLPKIARYYNISIDQLFGLSEEMEQEQIAKYIEQSVAYRNISNSGDDLKLWEEAFNEYPSNYLVMTNLVEALYFEDHDANKAKIIEYGNEVLQNSRDYVLHYRVLRRLCLTYIFSGQKEVAHEYILQLPDYIMTKGQLLLYLLDGEALIKQIQMNFHDLLDQIMINFEKIPESFYYGKSELKLDILKKQMTLCDTFFECKDYGFFNKFICSILREEIKEYMKRDDKAQVLALLEHVLPVAMECDIPTSYKYRSKLLDRLSYDSSKIIRYSKRDQCSIIQDLLKDSVFDPIRSDPRFVRICESLSRHKYIQKNSYNSEKETKQ